MECALLTVPTTQDQKEKKSPRQFRSIKEKEERHTNTKNVRKNIIKFRDKKIRKKSKFGKSKWVNWKMFWL